MTHRVFLFLGAALTALTWLLGSPDVMTRGVAQDPDCQPERWRLNVPHGDVSAAHVRLTWKNRNVVADQYWPLCRSHTRADESGKRLAAGSQDAVFYRVQAELRRHSSAGWVRPLNRQTLFFVSWLTPGGYEPEAYRAVTRFRGWEPRLRIDQVMRLPADVQQARVRFAVRHPGSWSLSGLNLQPVVIQPHYRGLMLTLGGAWLLLIGSAIHHVRRRLPWRWIVPVGVFVGIAVVGTALSPQGTQAILLPLIARVQPWLSSVLPGSSLLTIENINQIGHVVAFMGLSACGLLLGRRLGVSWASVVVSCLLLALATEALQRHQWGRSPQVGDLLLDVVGIVCGLLFVWGLRAGINKVRGWPGGRSAVPTRSPPSR